MAVTLYSSFNTVTGDLQVSDVESDVQLAGYTELDVFTNAALVVPDSWPWHSYRSEITTAKVKSVAQVFRTSYMFAYCSNLTSLDLSSFDTSNVTDMFAMLTDCSALRIIDISPDMPNVLAELPASQYYPASGGSPVAKADLTAGTWVRDEADLSKVATVVEQAQAFAALRRGAGELERRIAALSRRMAEM